MRGHGFDAAGCSNENSSLSSPGRGRGPLLALADRWYRAALTPFSIVPVSPHLSLPHIACRRQHPGHVHLVVSCTWALGCVWAVCLSVHDDGGARIAKVETAPEMADVPCACTRAHEG
jgi:hypothetical protein